MLGLVLWVRFRFSVWLVGGYAHVFILLSVAIVLYPVSCRYVVADQSASDSEPGCVGYARKAALPGNTDPRLGNRLFCSATLSQRGITQVCSSVS